MRTDSNQGSLWSLESSLVTVLDLLQIVILDCKSQLDIVDCSLGIVPPPPPPGRYFTLKQVVSLIFLGYHILCYLLFRCICYM